MLLLVAAEQKYLQEDLFHHPKCWCTAGGYCITVRVRRIAFVAPWPIVYKSWKVG
jgi:hypothetical protein